MCSPHRRSISMVDRPIEEIFEPTMKALETIKAQWGPVMEPWFVQRCIQSCCGLLLRVYHCNCKGKVLLRYIGHMLTQNANNYVMKNSSFSGGVIFPVYMKSKRQFWLFHYNGSVRNGKCNARGYHYWKVVRLWICMQIKRGCSYNRTRRPDDPGPYDPTTIRPYDPSFII